MKKIQKFLTLLLPADKAQHAFWGALFFLFWTLFVQNWWAILITLAFAVIWELAQDLFDNGKTEWQDVFYAMILPFLITIL